MNTNRFVMRNYQPFESLFVAFPKSEVSGFVSQSNREKFSRPVRVNFLFVKPNELVYVREYNTGRYYPVSPSSLKRHHELPTKDAKEITHA